MLLPCLISFFLFVLLHIIIRRVEMYCQEWKHQQVKAVCSSIRCSWSVLVLHPIYHYALFAIPYLTFILPFFLFCVVVIFLSSSLLQLNFTVLLKWPSFQLSCIWYPFYFFPHEDEQPLCAVNVRGCLVHYKWSFIVITNLTLNKYCYETIAVAFLSLCVSVCVGKCASLSRSRFHFGGDGGGICVCMDMCVQACVFEYVCKGACFSWSYFHIGGNGGASVCVYRCLVWVYVHVHVCACSCTCLSVCVCVKLSEVCYASVCVCVCVCVCVKHKIVFLPKVYSSYSLVSPLLTVWNPRNKHKYLPDFSAVHFLT